jgi:hypothetical protein
MINYKVGNLFTSLPEREIKIIPHIVNDVGGWGSGFVVPLSKAFPQTEQSYRDWHNEGKCRDVLGDHPFELGEVQLVDCGLNVIVANMIAQHSTITRSPGSTPIRYWALAKCLRTVGLFAKHLLSADHVIEIHAPKFGSGLAKGDWDVIEALIVEAWDNEGIPVTIYELEKTHLIVDYVKILHRSGGPESEEAEAFVEAHVDDPTFLRRAEVLKQVWDLHDKGVLNDE